jgi:hypothetical protein
MSEQRTRVERHSYARLPLWGRLILVTAMLLSEGSLADISFSRVAHADCIAGNGGNGGKATGRSSGAGGGTGGDCIFGAKGGEGGTSQGNGGANGGDVIVWP